MDYNVYLMLGFHINFYHSWRGDTPDEAGFGTDMRVIRGVLDILDRVNQEGKEARVYWDTEVYWTFQEILPKHCPDILERMRARVTLGLDEIVLGPFNNGANHAATADEFRAAVSWAIENPWGTGLRQLFPKVTPLYRPQETMFTTGQESLLKECGVEGLLLYYALVPFNTLSTFTPALPLERRYNPFWFRSHEEQPALVVLPCMAAADVIELSSLEALMLDLHARQTRGEVRSDVVIHLNEDADLETWLPIKLPRFLHWFPNTGGLEEYIQLVHKYPWAHFTVPGEYLERHPPTGEILVRQDLADGGFDGNYSWAEKCSSLRTWTTLERSRLASYRAEVLGSQVGMDLSDQLWDGMESSFFQRQIGLTTTHFGMSTPVINEERQARADEILGRSLNLALEAERTAARAIQGGASEALYAFDLFPTPPARDSAPLPATAGMRVPLILPPGVKSVRLQAEGKPVRAALTDLTPLPGGRSSCQVRFVANRLTRSEPTTGPIPFSHYRVLPAQPCPNPAPLTSLKNDWLEVVFSEGNGIDFFSYRGESVGEADFLQPFVNYRTRNQPVEYPVARWELLPLEGEQWDGLGRVRLRAWVPMQTPGGEYTNQFTYTFTLFEELPYLYVDVEARFAATPPTETVQNMIQKLRRLMDLRWVEVAPIQLHPQLENDPGSTLRVWKHNYLGITSYYDLNYGQVNPLNRNLDSFNHQVTAGWVAISNGKRGFLLGENAETLASMAFCPMRLREREGKQALWLNPFGSYHGHQLDYSHLGASGIGAEVLMALSGALKPNGPSYNGQVLNFSLMLAPYHGDRPPEALQADAAAHFYPPGIVYQTTPVGLEALLPCDLQAEVRDQLRRETINGLEGLPPPTALLANPTYGGVNLVWEAPQGFPVTGYQLAWRATRSANWQIVALPPVVRWEMSGLQNGLEYVFKLRGVCERHHSDWTAEQTCTPGAAVGSGLGGLTGLRPGLLVRLIVKSLWAVVRGQVSYRRNARINR